MPARAFERYISLRQVLLYLFFVMKINMAIHSNTMCYEKRALIANAYVMLLAQFSYL